MVGVSSVKVKKETEQMLLVLELKLKENKKLSLSVFLDWTDPNYIIQSQSGIKCGVGSHCTFSISFGS